MSIIGTLKRILQPSSKREVVRVCIENLQIDKTQKNLFLGSLEFLDDEGLDLLYSRVALFLEEIILHKQVVTRDLTAQSMENNRVKEQDESVKERNSFKILLDTI